RQRLEAGAVPADRRRRLRRRPRHRAPRGVALMRTRETNGMTLVELIAALAIFIGIAGLIIQVLGGGLDLWSTGERTRDESEQATALLDRIELELRHAVSADGGDGEPRVKMLCDVLSIDTNGDGTHDCRAQRLLFVRRLFEERTMVALHDAGTVPGGAQPWFGEADAKASDLLPTEGLVECALVPQPDSRKGYEGRLVLWRGLKSPIGGKQSLFERARRDGNRPEGREVGPLARDVPYFGLPFFRRSVQDATASADGSGVIVVWDSTRGILPLGEGYQGFRHARGPSSLEDPDDDVFPQAVRVSVILAQPPGEAPQASLQNELQPATGTIRVDVRNGQHLRKLGSALQLMKVGHEWVEGGDCDGAALTLGRRGLLGTAATHHPAGTPLLTGRRFERVIALPSPRSDLTSREAPEKKKG